MLCFFPCFVFSEFYQNQPGWTLESPFKYTDTGEIGNWTFRGAAVSFRNFIRLTSSHPNQYGAVCSRIPTTFDDWEAEVILGSYGGNAGAGFLITYSEELCPAPGDDFHGFQINIDTRSDEGDYFSPAYINITDQNMSRDESLACVEMPVRSDSDGLVLLITKKNGELELSFGVSSDDREDFQYCSNRPANISAGGYFTIAALTDANNTDDHDLYSFTLTALSHPQNSTTVDYSSINRRLLEDFVMDRRVGKQKRRAQMPLMLKYKSEPAANPSFADVPGLIREALWRANMSVTKHYVEDFVNSSISKKIDVASGKIDFALDRFSLFRTEVNAIWSTLRTQLLDIDRETKDQMNSLTRDLTNYAQIIAKGGDASAIYKTAYNDALTDMDDPAITLFFIGFCALEAAAYLVFFFYRLRRTQFFKKAD